MELLVARQPIFDARLQVCAYELLFRSSLKNSFDGSEGNSATSKVISAQSAERRFATPSRERFTTRLCLPQAAKLKAQERVSTSEVPC